MKNKISLLLKQHNGDDAPQAEPKIQTQSSGFKMSIRFPPGAISARCSTSLRCKSRYSAEAEKGYSSQITSFLADGKYSLIDACRIFRCSDISEEISGERGISDSGKKKERKEM